MITNILFISAFLLMALGVISIYKPRLIIRFNRIMRDKIFSDRIILFSRHKSGMITISIAFILFFTGYHRLHHARTELNSRIVSTDRLLYQSLQFIYSGEYIQAKLLAQSVLSRESGNIQAEYMLSAAEYYLQNYDEAVKILKKAQSHDSRAQYAGWYRRLISRYKTIPDLEVKDEND